MNARCLRLIFVVLFGLSARAEGISSLTGQATVVDADTIEIHGTRIRIHGVDAPESDQLCADSNGTKYRCGAVAANALNAFIARRPVSCVDIDERTYGRTVAVCTVDGVDIADWLVRTGHARDWPKYSKGGYSAAEREAQSARLGIWAGQHVAPWRYRACKRGDGRPETCSAR